MCGGTVFGKRLTHSPEIPSAMAHFADQMEVFGGIPRLEEA
jgi:hypothetical protein